MTYRLIVSLICLFICSVASAGYQEYPFSEEVIRGPLTSYPEKLNVVAYVPSDCAGVDSPKEKQDKSAKGEETIRPHRLEFNTVIFIDTQEFFETCNAVKFYNDMVERALKSIETDKVKAHYLVLPDGYILRFLPPDTRVFSDKKSSGGSDKDAGGKGTHLEEWNNSTISIATVVPLMPNRDKSERQQYDYDCADPQISALRGLTEFLVQQFEILSSDIIQGKSFGFDDSLLNAFCKTDFPFEGLQRLGK